jgi:flagellar basal-body rod protein FlgG
MPVGVIPALSIAAGGMIAQEQRLDGIADNVANRDTPGFEAVRAAVALGGRDTRQGPLEQTGRPLDVALEGPGYLQVRRSGGAVSLTRAGNLQVAGNGLLTTAAGEPLVPPIRIPASADPSQVAIAPTGDVSVQGVRVGRIQVVDATGAPARATLQQGALEGSNADDVDAAVGQIDTLASFEANAVVARIADETAAAALGIVR